MIQISSNIEAVKRHLAAFKGRVPLAITQSLKGWKTGAIAAADRELKGAFPEVDETIIDAFTRTIVSWATENALTITGSLRPDAIQPTEEEAALADIESAGFGTTYSSKDMIRAWVTTSFDDRGLPENERVRLGLKRIENMDKTVDMTVARIFNAFKGQKNPGAMSNMSKDITNWWQLRNIEQKEKVDFSGIDAAKWLSVVLQAWMNMFLTEWPAVMQEKLRKAWNETKV